MRQFSERFKDRRTVVVKQRCGHEVEVFEGSESLFVDEDCDVCRETAERRAKHEDRQRKLVERQASSGIPVAYHGSRLKDLDSWPTELVLACHTWVQQGGGLYVWGPVGTGKTTAAGAAAWELLDRMAVEWVTASRLGRWAAGAFGSEEHQTAQRLAGSPGALVLDDLGEEGTSEAVAAVIKDTLQVRIDHGSPLLITSNLPPGDVAERSEHLGQRVASRLQGYCHVVEVIDRDHRLDP